MGVKCEWTEEEIIDQVLGEDTDPNKKRHFENHLSYCRHCQDLYEHWSTVLSSEREDVEEEPADAIKRKVFQTISTPTRKHRFKGKRVLAACVALFLLFSGFYVGRLSLGTQGSPTQQPTVIHANDSHGFSDGHYQVVPVHQSNMNGYVWLDHYTKDIMMFIDGLKPINNRDYQAWLVSKDDKQNAGLVQMDRGFAHVIFHNKNAGKIDSIVISIEPRGGSAVQTGPNAINLDLTGYDTN